MEILNLRDLEALARARLPQQASDYYASGADDERCQRRNSDAFAELALHYRVLVDLARRDLATTVLGHRVQLPVVVAPTAFHRLAHKDGELASVRAAGDAGTVFTLSTLSNTRVEDVVAAASYAAWFPPPRCKIAHKDPKPNRLGGLRLRATGLKGSCFTIK